MDRAYIQGFGVCYVSEYHMQGCYKQAYSTIYGVKYVVRYIPLDHEWIVVSRVD